MHEKEREMSVIEEGMREDGRKTWDIGSGWGMGVGH